MSRQMVLTINTAIRNSLIKHKIPVHDGVSFLLNLYYGISPSFIPEELERKVLASGIVTKDYESNSIVWKIALFEETEIGFEWVTDWMDLFKKVNPERRGIKATVLTRMKKFFVNNPHVRKQDVLDATNRYLSSVSSPMYCKKSHKFIYEADGSSMLEDYVEQLLHRDNDLIHNNDVI